MISTLSRKFLSTRNSPIAQWLFYNILWSCLPRYMDPSLTSLFKWCVGHECPTDVYLVLSVLILS